MQKLLTANHAMLLLSLFGLLAWNSPALACNVPVFRFALERWQPDNYRLLLQPHGELNQAQRALLNAWETDQERKPSNAKLQSIDGLMSAGSLDQPQLALLYPPALNNNAVLWSASLSRSALQQMENSPQRRELVKRLVEGHSAVWLLVQSGNAEQDQAAEILLSAELKRLEQELKLPVLTDAPEDQLLGGPPLAVKFSVLVIPPVKDEEVFRQMLLHCEPDIPGRTEPLVYAVFGRGRSLLPMIGAGITADNIQEYAEFLVGACSCEIKEQNPGFDLLLAADWDALLKEQGYKPTAISSKDPLPRDPETVAIPKGSAKFGSTTVESAPQQATLTDIPTVPTAQAPAADPASPLKWFAGLGLAAILGLGVASRTLIRRV